jgi:iodotyrosine deiodinase
MAHSAFISLPAYQRYPIEEIKRRAAEFYSEIRRRRTVREYSDRPVPREVIEDCLRAAGTAPSGANMQPWHFVVVGERLFRVRRPVVGSRDLSVHLPV